MDDIPITLLKDDKLPFLDSPISGTNIKIWGNPTTMDTRVICSQSVIVAIEEHARSDHREVGGWLLGKAYRNKGIIFIEISVYLPAQNTTGAQSSQVHFSFTADIKAEMWKIKDKEYDDLKVVGWFHSHPSYGIFLSPMDENVQKIDFASIWHTALVFDPIKHEGGFYVWQGGELVQTNGFYELLDINPSESLATWRNIRTDENSTNSQQFDLRTKGIGWFNSRSSFFKFIVLIILIVISLVLVFYFLFFGRSNRLLNPHDSELISQVNTLQAELDVEVKKKNAYQGQLYESNATMAALQTIVATYQPSSLLTPSIDPASLNIVTPTETPLPTDAAPTALTIIP